MRFADLGYIIGHVLTTWYDGNNGAARKVRLS